MTVSVVSISREFERKNGKTQSGTKKQKTQKDKMEVYCSGMKLKVLGIVALLLLTGCSSSNSIQDQVLLIQYEKCLDAEREVWIAQSKDWSADTIYAIKEAIKKEGKTFIDDDLVECAKYLP